MLNHLKGILPTEQPFSDCRMPDWSDPETKLPGSLTIEQERAQKEQLELAKAVFEAAMLVKKAQSL